LFLKFSIALKGIHDRRKEEKISCKVPMVVRRLRGAKNHGTASTSCRPGIFLSFSPSPHIWEKRERELEEG
jgi:hypothetical protein